MTGHTPKEEVSLMRFMRSPAPGRAGVLALLLACGALAVAACGGSDNGGGSSSSGSSSNASGGAKKNYKMTLVAGVKGDEFYITMNCGAQAEAKKLGVTLNFQGPDQFAPDLQTPIVNAVAAKKPDAVLIAPTDTKAMFAPIKQLSDNGSKVVLVDTTLDQPQMAVSQISSDNEGGGKLAAQTLGKLIGGKGKVFVVNVKPGISTTDARGKGFQEGAKAAGLQYVGQQFDDDDPAKAAAIVKSALARNPDLKGIFATNLFSAEGAATGIREAGKQNQVKIVGFDAGPKQVADLKAGTVQALIAQKPADIGAQGVDQAYAALTGKPTKKQIGTGFVSLTKDNLAENQDAAYKASC
jgi:ribose transport system substrate-binding protein